MESRRPRDGFTQDQARRLTWFVRTAPLRHPPGCPQVIRFWSLGQPIEGWTEVLYFLIRLQKFLAECGVASRRAAEKLILEGRVRVNGQIVQELGKKVHPGEDRVDVDGSFVKVKRKVYLALNKPLRYLCTRTDPLNRRTVIDLLPSDWSKVYPVGRLDYESEGLLFLTNDGDFADQSARSRSVR